MRSWLRKGHYPYKHRKYRKYKKFFRKFNKSPSKNFYKFINTQIKLLLQSLGSPESLSTDNEHAFYAIEEENLRRILHRNLSRVFRKVSNDLLDRAIEFMISRGDLIRENGKIFLIKYLTEDEI